MDDKEEITYKIERYKALLDYSKQMTTLSTGSIVLTAGFVEKVFPNPQWKILTAISLVSFMMSVLGSIIAHTLFIVAFPPRQTQMKKWENTVVGAALLFAWGGFLVGILTLTTFATKNLV